MIRVIRFGLKGCTIIAAVITACVKGLALPLAWSAGDVSPPRQGDLARVTRTGHRQSFERMHTYFFGLITTLFFSCFRFAIALLF